LGVLAFQLSPAFAAYPVSPLVHDEPFDAWKLTEIAHIHSYRLHAVLGVLALEAPR
jgi:hypothetical protein